MKLNKKLQNIANESLENYDNQEFLTELLNMVETPVIIEKSFKLNKAVISGVALGLVLVVAVPVIIRATTGLNQTEVPKSTSAQTSNSTQYAPSPAPTGSTETSKSDDENKYHGETPYILCQFENLKDAYDIDNVTIKFYYGSKYVDLDFELENGNNIPTFDIILKNDQGGEILYKHIEENLVSEKYKYEAIYNEKDYIIDVNFSHSEEITIPKKLFTKESGEVAICIYGQRVHRYPDREELVYSGFNSFSLDYHIIDGKVVLTQKYPGYYFGF